MTSKHKFKKRVRARMQAEGTTYSAALDVERSKPVTEEPTEWPPVENSDKHLPAHERVGQKRGAPLIVELEEFLARQDPEDANDVARAVDAVAERFDQLRSLSLEAREPGIAAFVEILVRYAMRVSLGFADKVFDAAVGIDPFWTDHVTDLAEERWRLRQLIRRVRSAGKDFETTANELRAVIDAGVRSGLEAPPSERVKRSGGTKLTDADRELCALWESAPDVSVIFDSEARSYSGRHRVKDGSSEGQIVFRVQGSVRFASMMTDDEIIDRGPSQMNEATIETAIRCRVETILGYRKEGRGRMLVQALLLLEDEGMPNLDFINGVLAKLDDVKATEDELRSYLRETLGPRIIQRAEQNAIEAQVFDDVVDSPP